MALQRRSFLKALTIIPAIAVVAALPSTALMAQGLTAQLLPGVQLIPAISQGLVVFVNGFLNERNLDYTVIGDTLITFDAAPEREDIVCIDAVYCDKEKKHYTIRRKFYTANGIASMIDLTQNH